MCSSLSGCFRHAAAYAVVVCVTDVGDAIDVAEPSVFVSGEVETTISLLFNSAIVLFTRIFICDNFLMACAGSLIEQHATEQCKLPERPNKPNICYSK